MRSDPGQNAAVGGPPGGLVGQVLRDPATRWSAGGGLVAQGAARPDAAWPDPAECFSLPGRGHVLNCAADWSAERTAKLLTRCCERIPGATAQVLPESYDFRRWRHEVSATHPSAVKVRSLSGVSHQTRCRWRNVHCPAQACPSLAARVNSPVQFACRLRQGVCWPCAATCLTKLSSPPRECMSNRGCASQRRCCRYR